jgi:DNA-binding transcriptional ArsR family regulator
MSTSSLPTELYEQAAECLKALAHPKRLMILKLLSQGSYSVGDLAESIDVASNVASEHLRLLERCGFIRARREARSRFYEIIEPHVLDLLGCMETRFSEEIKQ